MDEIAPAKRSRHERRRRTGRSLDPDSVADVRKHLVVPEAHQAQLAPVRVGREILERVQERAEQPVRLVRRAFAARTAARASAEVDALSDQVAHEARRRRPPALFVREVVLHARARINLEFPRVDRSTQAWVDVSRVFARLVVGVAPASRFAQQPELVSVGRRKRGEGTKLSKWPTLGCPGVPHSGIRRVAATEKKTRQSQSFRRPCKRQ